MEVGLIEKEKLHYRRKTRKKTQYILKDHMFKFFGMNLFRKQPVSLKWGMEISIMKKAN